MTILSATSIRQAKLIHPMEERSKHEPTNTSYGLSMCGYDIRLDQDVIFRPDHTTLASSYEEFNMPNDVVGIVHDKSTWARRGLSVQNTVIEPGWRGFLTLEVLYIPLWVPGHTWPDFIEMKAGTPIAQILFHRIDMPTIGYGEGKYQNQERGPQGAR